MINHVSPLRVLVALLAGVLLVLHLAPAKAEDDAGSALKPIAKSQVRDPFYAPSVLEVKPAQGGGQDDAGPAVILVAKPQVRDPFYAATVLLVKPLLGGGHVGFVLNKPTRVSLGEVFPGDEPSKKVHDPLFFGGPFVADVVFALVRRNDSPGDGAFEFMKGLYIALSAETVDRIIRLDADHARFFVGVMIWQPGELDEELKRGAWYVIDADSDLALPSHTDGLWEMLVQRSRAL